ncbi:MAG TPA: M28 family metallopeptidase [Rhodothermales bacterium]|nr:M28 family metallopeptidase [Rhodothermales bacterium]
MPSILRLSLVLLIPAVAVMAFMPGRIAESPMLGFTDEGAGRQRALEARFDSLLDPANLDAWMKRMSARPQHLGSPYGKANAEFVASLFDEWGFETRIETFHVLFPTPRERLVELTGPTTYRARLDEPAIGEDASSSVREGMLPPYNAYSIDGDVTGELVYVNYGVPDDYKELARRGIDVKGKIVLARYGGSWRGIKPKVAAEHGAIGCLIYSDPRDDGYFQGDVYPEGPFRSEHGAQRGSVMDMPLHSGDPLTPGVGATDDAKRLSRQEVTVITKIPVLPLSHSDAMPLLKALEGPVAPSEWRGALPVTYHLGPGPARVRLKVAFDWNIVPVYNVIAKLEGREQPDQWIVRGNHRDAWVFGAYDPLSGQVALLEEARAIGALARRGWRPRRTIVYASWDGEEQGLIGSTEWAETHAEELDRKVVAYINSDSNGRGFLSAGGSHTLERFVNEVAREVTDPQTGVSVADRARARLRVNGEDEAAERPDLRLSPLGSGSDYSPFLQHLGIAALNLSFGGESGGGSYHSAYDTYDHFMRFGDPTFAYGIALAQTAGRMVLRLANADVLPLSFGGLADNVELYLDEVIMLNEDLRAETERLAKMLADSVFALAADPTETYLPPETETAVPYLNFAPLKNALAHLRESAEEYDVKAAAAVALSPESRAALDAILLRVERAMMRPDGLPRRPWYRHHIYAPGFYTGYGVKTLPGVREAIEQREWDEANAQIEVASSVLNAVAAEIDRAAALVP